ncbi:hypothetical protein Ae201684P_004712 [Aphanomyces euteiches]|nr:hypothetical protein Ae201684P_004712 [Aphanomyces euteiches]
MQEDKTSVHFLLNPEAVMPIYPEPRHGLQHLLSHDQGPWEIESAVQELISIEFQQNCLAKPIPTHRNKCSIHDCTTAAVSKGLCVRHGGGTRCSEPGCSKRTKRFRKCYIHGGHVLCSEQGCTSKAKRFGRVGPMEAALPVVKSTKLAVKRGLCWTHGGGSRCIVVHCRNRGYKRLGFMCEEHFGRV